MIKTEEKKINNGINWEAWGFTIEEIPRRNILTASPYDMGTYAYKDTLNPDTMLKKPSHYAWMRLLREVNEHGATMCEEWFDYGTFEKWYDENKYEFGTDEVYLKNGYWGDKNTYSPETCVFVPKTITMMLRTDFLEESRKRKYNLPVGISYARSTHGKINKGHYIVSLAITEEDRSCPVGRTDTLEEAFYFFKYMKEKHIKLYADSVKDKIPQRLYEYMQQFEWNDDISKYSEVNT